MEGLVDAHEELDVVIVGAGLSGIGAACHLRTECPGKTFTILEAREASGGTWDLFRYPGIRSDSDMFTLGYSFRPWEAAQAIADGPSILSYVRETAREFGVDREIRFNHRVTRAVWSSEDSRWTVEAQRTDTGETVRFVCSFVLICTGYYRYDEGYTPHFVGSERFNGQIVHPQHWPDDLDYAGERVVVIGSGATAVTLVPAMAQTAAHVTMLQRSPSYIVSIPEQDPIAKLALRLLPTRLAYALVRWKNVLLMLGFYRLSRRRPKLVKRLVRRGVTRMLPRDFDVDTHFKPPYDPWDQRLCVVPDGDLFRALRSGRASIVTDRITTFTETGLELESGARLEADIIITATGLNLLPLGGIDLVVDGAAIALPETMAYKGMMLSGVPNMAFAVGYTNASWTLKADLTAEYFCRLINYMDAHGYRRWVARRDPTIAEQPLLDLASGYVLRSVGAFPVQGARPPWRLYQNYIRDVALLRRGAIDDGVIEFSNGREPVTAAPVEEAEQVPA
jgi:cation diffusion facilitator CzcD-associated flavoprotein CzcO